MRNLTNRISGTKAIHKRKPKNSVQQKHNENFKLTEYLYFWENELAQMILL